MNNQEIAVEDLEKIYDTLADSIDQAGEGNHSLYLTKLALILSAKLNDKEIVLQAMQDALKDL